MQLKSLVAILAAAVLAASPAISAEVEHAPEPEGYRMSEYRGPVPTTLTGGRVIDTDAAEALSKKGDAIFFDVYPQAPKPPNLPKSTVWRTPRHDTIKGAVWLPNVGYGVLNPEFEKYFHAGLEKYTGGDKAKTLVFFCLRQCWMSWNAAKRALEWGYTNVIWYPDGTDGWKEWNLPTEMRTPEE